MKDGLETNLGIARDEGQVVSQELEVALLLLPEAAELHLAGAPLLFLGQLGASLLEAVQRDLEGPLLCLPPGPHLTIIQILGLALLQHQHW